MNGIGDGQIQTVLVQSSEKSLTLFIYFFCYHLMIIISGRPLFWLCENKLSTEYLIQY